jgi:hypothetical protein
MTSDQKQEDSLKLFLKRFDCAFNQTKQMGLHPMNSMTHWGLSCSNHILKLENNLLHRGAYLNPISIMLNGLRINQKIFGKRKNYDGYLTNNYPFYNIEDQLFLQRDLLYVYFSDGYAGNSSFKDNNYIEGIAANLGIFISNKYFAGRKTMGPWRRDWFI